MHRGRSLVFLLCTIIHAHGIGLDTCCVYLATRENRSYPKLVKVGKVGYHARLRDLHRSNPFFTGLMLGNDELRLPDAW